MSQAREPALPGMRLTTYLELETIVQAFARGHLRLLILIGGHGLGKSRIVRQTLAGRACWLEGNLSVFGLYCQLWEKRNLTVVLDDVDGLYAQRDGVRLLKCLTQSEPIKSVSWHTDAPTLQRQGIPQEFRTRSRVAIIANEWKTLNRNVAALQDRGHLLLGPGDLRLRAGAAALARGSLDAALPRRLGAEASGLGLAQSDPEPLSIRMGSDGGPIEGGPAVRFRGRTGASVPGRGRGIALDVFQLVQEAPNTGEFPGHLLEESTARGQGCRRGPSQDPSPPEWPV